MGFPSDKVGFKGDLRFFRGFNVDENIDPVDDPAEATATQILSELQFRRATAGVAFRW